MLNAKKLMIAVLAIVTIGAGSAFAWTTSQTGHCQYKGNILYPFLDWTYPGTGDTISGNWNTGVQRLQGFYSADFDSTTNIGGVTKTYYSGQWGVEEIESATLIGSFQLVRTNYYGTLFEWWSGTWVKWTLTPPLISGTMTGTTED